MSGLVILQFGLSFRCSNDPFLQVVGQQLADRDNNAPFRQTVLDFARALRQDS